MRRIVGVLALLASSCDSTPPDDQPDDPCAVPPYIGCMPPQEMFDVTVHWSFETLSGDMKAPCLPGDPDVRLSFFHILSASFSQSYPCASGDARITLKEGTTITASSMTDHLHQSANGATVVGPGDLPTIVTYTDAGNLTVEWSLWSLMTGSATQCEWAGIAFVRISLDGVVTEQVSCSDDYPWATIRLVSAGTHSLQVDGLDTAGTVLTMEPPKPVTVLAATTVTAKVDLHH